VSASILSPNHVTIAYPHLGTSTPPKRVLRTATRADTAVGRRSPVRARGSEWNPCSVPAARRQNARPRSNFPLISSYI
jgi:hypothetical protein